MQSMHATRTRSKANQPQPLIVCGNNNKKKKLREIKEGANSFPKKKRN
jgi:hypothetical protein